jgi:hypothetical protein
MKFAYQKSISKPVALIIPIINKPIHFESMRECARFVALDIAFIRSGILYGSLVRGMEVKEVQNA